MLVARLRHRAFGERGPRPSLAPRASGQNIRNNSSRDPSRAFLRQMAVVEIIRTSGFVSEGTSPSRTSDPLQGNVSDVSDLFGLQQLPHCNLRRRTIRHLDVLVGTTGQIGRYALQKNRGVAQHNNRSIVLCKQAQSLLKPCLLYTSDAADE